VTKVISRYVAMGSSKCKSPCSCSFIMSAAVNCLVMEPISNMTFSRYAGEDQDICVLHGFGSSCGMACEVGCAEFSLGTVDKLRFVAKSPS
jgi:hypothetical protein